MSGEAELGLHYSRPVFFDLETSGLDYREHQIIQIAAQDARTGATFERKLKFDMRKADPLTMETSVYDKTIWREEAIDPDDACREFADWLQGYKSIWRVSAKSGKPYAVAVLAGYNCNEFDKKFVFEWFKSAEIFMPADFRTYDFYPLSMIAFPGLERYTLEAVCGHLNLIPPGRKFHDARHDVQATIEVAACCLAEFFDDEDERLPRWAIKTMRRINKS